MTGPRALCTLLALLCAVGLSVAAAPEPAVADTFVGYEDSDCPVDIPGPDATRVTCGYLTVPESRAEGSDPAKTISLPVAVIAGSGDASDDPIVFPTAGGPGGGSLGSLWYWLEYADWAGDRDIVVVEQRGDALSNPSLDCPEVDVAQLVADGVRPSIADDDTLVLAQLEACRDRLLADGVDLAAYTSAESAADLADLRASLGYDEWNLYGVSYGARLALTTMRDRPEGLRAVILDGVYPPNVNRYEALPTGLRTALDQLIDSCAAAADCRRGSRDLERTLTSLLAQAEEEPLRIDVKSPDGSGVTLELGDRDLAQGLFDALYDPEAVRVLPFVIDQLAAGDAGAALPLAQREIDAADSTTDGLQLSVDCAEEVPFTDDARVAAAVGEDPILAHLGAFAGVRDRCTMWGVPALSDVENAAVASDIPTLLMSGGYDPVTPLEFSQAASATLSQRYIFHFPTMGHGAVWANWVDDCPASIARQFLADPAVAPDGSCADDMPPTDFLTVADIHPTTAIYRFDRDVLRDREPVPLILGGLSVLVLILTLLYTIGYGIAWLARRRGHAPGGAVLAAAMSSTLNLAYVGAFALILANTDPMILALGIPPAAAALVILPFTALAATIVLVVVLIRAWRIDDGSGVQRLLLSISAVAALVFPAWLLARGLLVF